jgi:uncharacterized protein with HEPN domain
MQPNERDAAYLWDMLQAARRVQEFTANLSREAYIESVLIQSAVERQLEIIGEAARRVSEAFQQSIQKFHGAQSLDNVTYWLISTGDPARTALGDSECVHSEAD